MQCTLRRASVDDAEAMDAIRREPGARIHQPLEQKSLIELREQLSHRADVVLDSCLERKVQWTIVVNGQIAGWISLDVTSRKHGIASVGYTVSEAFRGKGVATCAVQQLTEIAFKPTGIALGRLEAVASVGNLASQRVLIKSGFIQEGIARGLLVIAGQRVDHVRFGLLRSDLH